MQRISGDTGFSRLQRQLALDRLPAAAYTCDAAGQITYFNEQALKLWGRKPKLNSPEERYCGSFRLYYPTGQPMPHDQCWMAKALREEREFIDEPVMIERADSSRVIALASARPIFDDDGALIGATNLLLDVTRSSELARVQERLAAIVDSSDDAITSTTTDGYITSWNASATRIFGYTPEEALGKHISLFVPPEGREGQLQILERLKRGERVQHFETSRVTKDGRVIELSMTMSPLRDHDGRVVGISAISRDITEQKARARELTAAKEAAEAANRMKDRLLAVVGHELRAPLNAISLAASALGLEENLSPTARVHIGAIGRNVSLQNELIEDLLDRSRIAAGKLHMNMAQIKLDAVLREACHSVAGRMSEKGLRLRCDLGARDGYVNGDRLRLRQVFINLLENALKFTPAGGEIFVRSTTDTGRVSVAVRDNGSGISATFLPRVFDPFETEELGAARNGGLGLGLAICKSLVERHGGGIAAHSEGPGRGATFVVSLPLSE